MTGHRTPYLGILLVLLLTTCGGQSPTETAPLTSIRLPMGYVPDPQYAPLYVADHRGYFAAEGLELEFDYSYETDGVTLVGAEELSFALVSGEQVIMARSKGLPVVYVMQWFQKYPTAVIAKAEAGIKRPTDLAGRRVGIPGLFGTSYVGFEGLLAAVGLTDSDLDLVETGFSQAEALAQDQVEAVVVYANNEPVRLAQQGTSLDIILVSDYVDMVANGLMTNEMTIQRDPELVESMVRAILMGLSDVLEDPDEAFEICKQYVDGIAATPQDERANRAVLEASLEMWRAPRLGISAPEAWDMTQQVLLTIDFVQQPVDLTQVMTNRFVDAATLR